MVRIAIVEDESHYTEQLVSYLRQLEQEIGTAFDIVTYTDGDGIVNDYRAQFDIILMDIDMKFMDGMSAAEEIRKIDSEVVIMFITNLAQYAIRGYAVDALDYVLKPVSYFAFSQRFKRALTRMKKRETKTLSLSTKSGTMRLDMADIYYIESQGHTMIVRTASGSHETYGVMKEFESRLSEYHFIRGNKGYLINLAHVDSVKDNCAVVRGEELLLSRARKKDFMEALAAYWGGISK